MEAHAYELTDAQASFLETVARPSPKGGRMRSGPARARFPGTLPPVADQSVRGTCVASAVAALVACYEGCRRRVSVQYLDEVTRLVERTWVGRNLKRLVSGEAPEKDFEAAFPDAVSQATLLVRANGAGSEAAAAFVRSLGAKIRARVESDAGCRLKRCFEALEEYGACREELWPYSPVALNAGAAGGDAVGAFPPGTHEDARRHRIVNGLYVLRSPNNVDEIKGILAGARGRRPMPVCVGLDLFEGCTDGAFSLPTVVRESGRAHVAERPLGIHEVLLVAYTDDATSPGGGHFTFQNSWGCAWGKAGTGCVSYAYVACFCREAGTILQEPDDYGPAGGASAKEEAAIVARRRATILCAVGICLAAAAVSVAFTAWSVRRAAPAAPAPVGRESVPQPTPVRSVSAPQPVRPAPVSPKPQPPDDGADDDFRIVKVVDYGFRVRGTCDSTSEAIDLAYVLDGAHRDFTFEDIHLTDDRHGFEGEVTIEGLAGRPPDVARTVEGYLNRKKIGIPVRKWDVQRLRNHQDKSNVKNQKKGKKS